ncbi:MAG: DNA-protecting protein DprA [Nitrosopumilus sp.]|nr:DNA-protecting protein DprA [Nitrosopumilus sp.]
MEQKYAPHPLYCAGTLETPLVQPKISIVGSRNAEEDGLLEAARVAREAVENGVVVISGLAKGIDTAAHRAAIKHSGRTVGVIGTPLDKAYPRENAALQQQMVEEQLVVSQFPVGYNTQRRSFVERNRTMALLTDATVIIRASDRSGSLHQGWEALRLGRPLFLSRTVMNDPELEWPEEMTKYGARELCRFEDMLAYLPPSVDRPGLLNA